MLAQGQDMKVYGKGRDMLKSSSKILLIAF